MKPIRQLCRELGVHRSCYYRRVNMLGFTREEALHCPKDMPLWMYRIEQEEGQSVRGMLADTASTAKETGYTMADLAREWGVNHHTLQHWCRKWGIQFPRGASWMQKEVASAAIQRINQRRRSAL